MTKYAIYVDLKRCIGCYACVVACNNWHEENSDVIGRIRIVDIMRGKHPDVMRWVFPILCMQCEDAPCIKACPEGAINKREDGIVEIEEDQCIGCAECVDACPYGVMQVDNKEGKAKKCDFCLDRVEKGLRPFCVETCPTDALIFGNLEDIGDKLSKMVASKKVITLLREKGTKPLVFYTDFPELNEMKALQRTE